MHPLVHPGVAYLLFAGWRRGSGGEPPGDAATVSLVVGAVLPDLVDQPLYHLFFDLPSTRAVGHSLLFLLPLCLIVWVTVRRTDLPNEVGVAFAVGALSHLAADALWPLVVGAWGELGFLLWPLTHSPPYAGEKPLVTVAGTTVTSRWIEWPLLAIAVGLWWRDGRAGLAAVVRALGRE